MDYINFDKLQTYTSVLKAYLPKEFFSRLQSSIKDDEAVLQSTDPGKTLTFKYKISLNDDAISLGSIVDKGEPLTGNGYLFLVNEEPVYTLQCTAGIQNDKPFLRFSDYDNSDRDTVTFYGSTNRIDTIDYGDSYEVINYLEYNGYFYALRILSKELEPQVLQFLDQLHTVYGNKLS